MSFIKGDISSSVIKLKKNWYFYAFFLSCMPLFNNMILKEAIDFNYKGMICPTQSVSYNEHNWMRTFALLLVVLPSTGKETDKNRNGSLWALWSTFGNTYKEKLCWSFAYKLETGTAKAKMQSFWNSVSNMLVTLIN